MFLLVLAAVFLFSSAYADELRSDSVEYTLPEQTITGTRRERNWLDNASAITTVRAQEAPVHRAVGLSDELMLVPGLVAGSRFGTDDIRLAIRGMGARSNSGVRGVRVLYDGIPESEPDGQTRLEGIEVGSLDRVEVLRGAGSALYGNAAGGVVNLLTPESFTRSGVRVDAQGGSFGFYKVKLSAGTAPHPSDTSISASVDLRGLSFTFSEGASGEGGTVSASHTVAEGWREHSEYEGQIVNGSWTMKATPRAHLRTLFYFTNVSAQLPGPITDAQFRADPLQADSTYRALDVRRYTRKGRLGLHYTRHVGSDVTLNFTPYGAVKKLDRARETGVYQLITRYILGATVQGEWEGEIRDFETEVTAGVDQQFQDGPVSFYENVNGMRGDSLLSEDQERQWGQGAFVQWEVDNVGVWGALFGLRYDRVYFYDEILNSSGPAITYERDAVTPRIGFRYHIGPAVAFMSLHGGFETPTLSEAENNLNYRLEPQRTFTGEFGVRGESTLLAAQARWEVTGYQMIVRDAIVPDRLEGERLFTNAAQAVHRGLEISGKLSRPRVGYVGLAASVGDFVFTDYATALGDFTDKKLPGVSPNLFSAVVRWTPRDFLFAEISARASGSAWANTENTVKADGWTVLNAAIGGRLPMSFLSASWHAGIQNITDEEYVSFIQVNDSRGRYFESGMPQAIVGGISIGTP